MNKPEGDDAAFFNLPDWPVLCLFLYSASQFTQLTRRARYREQVTPGAGSLGCLCSCTRSTANAPLP